MIIGIAGLIGSGKDTIASYLIDEYGFKRMSFAESLKDAASSIFGWDREMLDGVTKNSREEREKVDEWWSKRLGIDNLTPRWVLQYLGTDVFRKHFHNDIWVASIENKLSKTKDDVVITDSRFKNEIEAIHRSGGHAIRVVRGSEPPWYEAAVAFNSGTKHISWATSKKELEKYNIHASEYSHIGLDYDSVIENNGTIDELNSKIDSIIQMIRNE